MVTITDKNRFIEFAFSNETHLIEKTNIKFIQLDEFVAVYDNSDRQRNDKRFILKYDEISNQSFTSGDNFYLWIANLVGAEIETDLYAQKIAENTTELTKIKHLNKEILRYLKKIYEPI